MASGEIRGSRGAEASTMKLSSSSGIATGTACPASTCLGLLRGEVACPALFWFCDLTCGTSASGGSLWPFFFSTLTRLYRTSAIESSSPTWSCDSLSTRWLLSQTPFDVRYKVVGTEVVNLDGYDATGMKLSECPVIRDREEIISIFGEPYWTDFDDSEIILFYEFQESAIELQFEFPDGKHLEFITLMKDGILSKKDQRESYGVTKPWPSEKRQ